MNEQQAAQATQAGDVPALVAAVRAHALAHYEQGWDTVVECWDDSDILAAIGKATTAAGAISQARRLLSTTDSPAATGLEVVYRGIDGTSRRKFPTLAEVQAYVRARWEGVDYIDGPDGFHNDYGAFTLVGCTLADLGTRCGDDSFDWAWTDVAQLHRVTPNLS